MADEAIERLVALMSALPGLGRRSARRAALYLLARRADRLVPLQKALHEVAESVQACAVCGTLDTRTPCRLCANPKRSDAILCVVEETADVWALERAGVMPGRYHVLGGVLKALEGIGPEDLNIETLIRRAGNPHVEEVILATNATMDGQTTAYYLAERLADCDIRISRLARGVPVGSELDYMDEGTLADAIRQRRPLSLPEAGGA